MGANKQEPQTNSTRASYTVLARRYRSRDFDEIIGQEPIARTLQNAVKSGRTAHAYLFCGTRGVGKTSMARILARALNVTDDLTQAGEIADAILRGDDLDVIEIDGASNRGINEARDLIAGAGLKPARCPCKIYIIDEVHQITKDAFNALLKTMEEPPEHVKFILCTTEPHKVPSTIQSRCQRFDFRVIPTAKIAKHLRAILEQEGVEADDQVVAQIARLGTGSMRDSLSLLDRLLAAGDVALTPQLLDQMLGLPDQTLAGDLVDAIAAGRADKALEAGAALLASGTGIEQSLEILIEYLRNLMLIDACGADSELVELSREARNEAAERASHFDSAGLAHMIAVCDAVAHRAKGSAAARALFDAAIVRLCLSERFADIGSLLAGTPPAEPKKKERVSPSPPITAEHTRVIPDVIVEPRLANPPPADEGEELWRKVAAFATGTANEQALIENLAYQAFDGTTLTLSIQTSDEGLAGWLTDQTRALGDLVRRATSRRVGVVIAASDIGAAKNAARRRREEARQLPLVRTVMEIFDADVVDVQDNPASRGVHDAAAGSPTDAE